MKRVGIFCLTLALLLSCLSCGKEVQTRTFFLMDTGITVTLYTQDMARAEEIFAAVDATIDLICAMTGLDITIFGKYAELKKEYTEDEEYK
jgi:hypothetical protein